MEKIELFTIQKYSEPREIRFGKHIAHERDVIIYAYIKKQGNQYLIRTVDEDKYKGVYSLRHSNSKDFRPLDRMDLKESIKSVTRPRMTEFLVLDSFEKPYKYRELEPKDLYMPDGFEICKYLELPLNPHPKPCDRCGMSEMQYHEDCFWQLQNWDLFESEIFGGDANIYVGDLNCKD